MSRIEPVRPPGPASAGITTSCLWAYEAGIQAGVEAGADHPERPVPSHDGQERRDSVRWPA